MQFGMNDVYDINGMIKEEAASSLAGHRQQRHLLPNLRWLNQHLSAKTDVTLREEAERGLYFSLLSEKVIRSANDVETIQICYQPKNIQGEVFITKGQEYALLQAHISADHLAAVLAETENQIIQHFTTMRDQLGNNNGVISLCVTEKTRAIIDALLSHEGQSISLAGHVYSLIFTLIEQLQIQSHLTRCENCQSKIFKAQNFLEMPDYDVLNIPQLARLVGLNTTALLVGFQLFVGQSIDSYYRLGRIKCAAALLREDPSAKSYIVAQSGFSEAQFEAAFIKQFGISSHHYAQIH